MTMHVTIELRGPKGNLRGTINEELSATDIADKEANALRLVDQGLREMFAKYEARQPVPPCPELCGCTS